MVGAVVYVIKSENFGSIPSYNGRLLHAAFFQILNNNFPQFTDYLHNNTEKKPFALSGIFPTTSLKKNSKNGNFFIEKNDEFYVRVSALNEAMYEAIISIPINQKFRLGSINFAIIKKYLSPNEHEKAGCIEKEKLISEILTLSEIKIIEFSFNSPTTFRFFDRDYPCPLPEYIFGSIAEKWIEWDDRKLLPITKEDIKRIAGLMQPARWKGESVVLFQREQRRIFAFVGNFSYGLNALNKEEKQILIILSEFANFSGVGRLTSQGLGAVSVKYQ